MASFHPCFRHVPIPRAPIYNGYSYRHNRHHGEECTRGPDRLTHRKQSAGEWVCMLTQLYDVFVRVRKQGNLAWNTGLFMNACSSIAFRFCSWYCQDAASSFPPSYAFDARWLVSFLLCVHAWRLRMRTNLCRQQPWPGTRQAQQRLRCKSKACRSSRCGC